MTHFLNRPGTRLDEQRGFTLIELMIVIAIVGILSAVALPAYQNYTLRAKMAEPIAKLAEVKTSIAEYYAINNQLPPSASAAGINASIDTDIVDRIVWVPAGRIAIFVQDVGGDTGVNNVFGFSLKSTTSGVPEWNCVTPASGGVNPEYLPSTCRRIWLSFVPSS